tara:strand:+ start:1503 stop:1823 length:321 start_codon:yes stop_codon:yes gene_type:complete
LSSHNQDNAGNAVALPPATPTFFPFSPVNIGANIRSGIAGATPVAPLSIASKSKFSFAEPGSHRKSRQSMSNSSRIDSNYSFTPGMNNNDDDDDDDDDDVDQTFVN